MAEPGGAAAGAPAIVIPAFQAAATLADVLVRVRAAAPAACTWVVDDGSADGTDRVAERGGARVVRHAANLGKGRALASGVAAALGAGAGCVVTLDADGQHPPEAIPAFLAPLDAGAADLVLGARQREGAMPWPRRGTNWLSSALVSRALGTTVADSQCGFRAFTRALGERVRPACDRYDYETEFLLQAGAAGFRIAAVPLPTLYGVEPSHFRYGEDTLRLTRVFLRHWRPILLGPDPR